MKDNENPDQWLYPEFTEDDVLLMFHNLPID